jgi:predicted Zn-dependent peptidase
MADTVRKTILDNGVRILSKKIPHVRSVSMGIWVNVGARDEKPEENGLSHFIEHMLFKGTKTRSAFQIAKEFDAIGGQSNAFTSAEYTCYHGRVLDTHLETMVSILSDIFLNSEFSQAEIENERPVILSEISMLEDTPDEYVHTLLEENFWKNHALGRSILGSPESVSSFDSTSVETYFRTKYKPQSVIISAAGNVDHDQLVALLSPPFSGLARNGEPENRVCPSINVHTKVYKKNLEQVHICMAMNGLTLTHPDRFACSLLNAVLGGNMSSRLFQEIREKRGLAYSVYSFSSLNMDSGLFGIYTGVAKEHVEKTLSLILSELNTLSENGITETELSDAKEYAKGGILLGSESTENQMVRLAQNEIHFGRYVPLRETIDNMARVTMDDIRRTAAYLFRNGRPSLTLLGPYKNRKQLDTILDSYMG